MYRNQFILGPEFAPALEDWQRLRAGPSHCVTAHPSLGITVRSSGARTLTLVGYALDPFRPDDGDDAIVEQLLQTWEAGANLFCATEHLGGRWVLIADQPSGSVLFHDAGGLRQVFHTQALLEGGIWCASQPPLLTEFLALEIDEGARSFLESRDFQEMSGGAWWPGSGSLWRGVRRLLPNHALDLRSGTVHRYWPMEPLGRIGIDRAVESGSALLKGLVSSAAQRFDLELLITSGWDSRLLLAACKDVAPRMSFVSLVTPDGPRQDATVPAELLGLLGLDHTIETPPSEPNAEFWSKYSRNAMLAQKTYAGNAQILERRLAGNKVAITGHMGEIVKGFYKLAPIHAHRLPPRAMTRLTGLGESEFARQLFEEWRTDAKPIYDMPILDLFYWEQRVGSWLPTWLLGYDYSWQDGFIPMNCRRFLTDMLAVSKCDRRPPVIELYRRLILAMWPEVLTSPIGKRSVPARPATRQERFVRDARAFAKDARNNANYLLGRRSNPSGA